MVEPVNYSLGSGQSNRSNNHGFWGVRGVPGRVENLWEKKFGKTRPHRKGQLIWFILYFTVLSFFFLLSANLPQKGHINLHFLQGEMETCSILKGKSKGYNIQNNKTSRCCLLHKSIISPPSCATLMVGHILFA